MQDEKIIAANAVLAAFSTSQIERRPGGWYVAWKNYRGDNISRRWQCRKGNDFYPVWSRKWDGGGTACTALSQLIRWLRSQPVLPISSWRYWASDRMRLLPLVAVEMLADGGYPQESSCVLCEMTLVGGLDWWNLDGVSGPCCSWTNGCRQKRNNIVSTKCNGL